MFHVNKKLFLLCAHRRLFFKCLLVNPILELDYIKTFSSTVALRKKKSISLLFTPVPVKPVTDPTNTGEELAGKLDKGKLIQIINVFFRKPEVKILAENNGIDDYLFVKGFASFRKYCLDQQTLPADLHIILCDIVNGGANHLDIFPYFLRHMREIFPHLHCMDDLKKIGDLRTPANWYPNARSRPRKIIFHCGPTNSGKTYHALERFIKSESGVYCGPLKLLAVEVFNKANDQGTPCDLITGEDISYVRPDGDASKHTSCTIEMCSVETVYDVAVIDEIQMIKDQQRGWAWTRALLGLRAKEIHLCGEEAAINLIDSILCTTNEELEVKKYDRLTKLHIDQPIERWENIKPGDCIVCFNKNDIYNITRTLENLNKEVAVIYGTLPPGTKLTQCKKFNDPDDPCKILVATDAVGMGLNLSIRRVIFYSLLKPSLNENNELELVTISVSQALQIAGRAGRFGSQYPEGYTTTFRKKDFPVLKELLSKTPETVVSAGLLPTIDQIELYSYYLPSSSLSNLIEIFTNLSTVDDSLYFICDLKNFLFLSNMLEHIPLPLRVKYTFCCAPINKNLPFVCTMFLKFARIFSENNVITFKWLQESISWPVSPPENIQGLIKLEATHDVLDLYLWLSYRFPDYFPDGESVKQIQQKLDTIVYEGVVNMTKLLKHMKSRNEKAKPMEGLEGEVDFEDTESLEVEDVEKRKKIETVENLLNKFVSGYYGYDEEDRKKITARRRLFDEIQKEVEEELENAERILSTADQLMPDSKSTTQKGSSKNPPRPCHRYDGSGTPDENLRAYRTPQSLFRTRRNEVQESKIFSGDRNYLLNTESGPYSLPPPSRLPPRAETPSFRSSERPLPKIVLTKASDTFNDDYFSSSRVTNEGFSDVEDVELLTPGYVPCPNLGSRGPMGINEENRGYASQPGSVNNREYGPRIDPASAGRRQMNETYVVPASAERSERSSGYYSKEESFGGSVGTGPRSGAPRAAAMNETYVVAPMPAERAGYYSKEETSGPRTGEETFIVEHRGSRDPYPRQTLGYARQASPGRSGSPRPALPLETQNLRPGSQQMRAEAGHGHHDMTHSGMVKDDAYLMSPLATQTSPMYESLSSQHHHGMQDERNPQEILKHLCVLCTPKSCLPSRKLDDGTDSLSCGVEQSRQSTKFPVKPTLTTEEINELIQCETEDVESAWFLTSESRKLYKKPCPKQQKAQMSVRSMAHGHEHHQVDTCEKVWQPLADPDPEDISPEVAAAMMFSQELGIKLESCPKDTINHLFPDETRPQQYNKQQSSISIIDPNQKDPNDLIEKSAGVPSDGVSDSAYSRTMKQKGDDMVSRKSDDLSFGLGTEKREYLLVPKKPQRYNSIQFRGNLPTWFPGYFAAYPNQPEIGMQMVSSPSKVFHRAWAATNPGNVPKSDLIVLD